MRFLVLLARRLLALFCSCVLAAGTVSAQSWEDYPKGPGATDYTQHAEALSTLFQNLTALMIKVVGLVDAIAAVVVIISALQIYMKMQNGEDGVRKAVLQLFWAIIFLISATIVFPSLFGFRLAAGDFVFS